MHKGNFFRAIIVLLLIALIITGVLAYIVPGFEHTAGIRPAQNDRPAIVLNKKSEEIFSDFFA